MFSEHDEASLTSLNVLPDIHLLVLGFLDTLSLGQYLVASKSSASVFPTSNSVGGGELVFENHAQLARVQAFVHAIAPSILASFRASLLPWSEFYGWTDLRNTLSELRAWETARQRLPRSKLPSDSKKTNNGGNPPSQIKGMPRSPLPQTTSNYKWWKVVPVPDAHVALGCARGHTMRMRASLVRLAGAPTTEVHHGSRRAMVVEETGAAGHTAVLKLRQIAMASAYENMRTQWQSLRETQAIRALAAQACNAAAQASAVQEAALWYSSGSSCNARCVEGHFRTETLDRRTGGALAYEATVVLAPRHLSTAAGGSAASNNSTATAAQRGNNETINGNDNSTHAVSTNNHTAAAVKLMFVATAKCNDTSMLRVCDFSASCHYYLHGDELEPRTLYNLRSHGAATISGPPADWPLSLVEELSTALFGQPVEKRLLAAFLVAVLNPGGSEDGGAFRSVLEDELLFGTTEVHDDDLTIYRKLMVGCVF